MVPSTWTVRKLGEICEINPRKTEAFKLPQNLEVGFLAMADISENARITRWQRRELGTVKVGFTFFKNGDVILAKITPCMENGKGALIEDAPNGMAFGSTEFHVLRPDQKFLSSSFLSYLVLNKAFRERAKKYMTGSAGQQRLPASYLESFKVKLPPERVQEQIVDRLNVIRNAQKLNASLIQKADELLGSVLQVELGHGKKNWEIKKMIEVSKLHMGGTPSTKIREYYDGGSINWMKSGDVKGNFVTEVSGKITEQGLKDSNAKIYPVNSVVIALNGQGKTRATAAILKVATSSNQSVAAFTDFGEFLKPEILYYQLKMRYSEIRRITGDNTRSGLNLGILGKLKVYIPPQNEQERIVSKLAIIQNYREQLFEQRAKLDELFDSTLTKALSGGLIKENVVIIEAKKSIFPTWQAIGAVLQHLKRGEMVIAKLLYIAQEIYDVPLGFNFTSQNFGPYDLQIKKAITSGASRNNGFFQRQNDVYVLGINANKLFKYNSGTLTKMNNALSDLMPTIRNSTSLQIECLATVCKVIQDLRSFDLALIQNKVEAWKPNKFSDAQIKGAFDFIKSRGWDKKLIRN